MSVAAARSFVPSLRRLFHVVVYLLFVIYVLVRAATRPGKELVGSKVSFGPSQSSSQEAGRVGAFESEELFFSRKWDISFGGVEVVLAGESAVESVSTAECVHTDESVPGYLENGVLSLRCPNGGGFYNDEPLSRNQSLWKSYRGPVRTEAHTVLAACSVTCASSDRFRSMDGELYFCTKGLRLFTQVRAKNDFRGKEKQAKNPPNLVVVHIESASRPSFAANFKKTISSLRTLNNNSVLKTFSFPFSTRSGGTYDFFLAAFSGSRWTAGDGSEGNLTRAAQLPWVWKLLKARGYVTALAAEMPFATPLVDFFVRSGRDGVNSTNWSYETMLGDHALVDVFSRGAPPIKPTLAIDGDILQGPICFGGRAEPEFHFSWGMQFLQAYAGHPSYIQLHGMYGHVAGGADSPHSLKRRVAASLQWYDKALSKFIADLYATSSAYLRENTILVLVSDHGVSHFPDVLGNTVLSVSVPGSWLRDYPAVVDALQNNQQRIISHVDLYCTLVDRIGVSSTASSDVSSRGACRDRSLFGKLRKRSCADLGLDSTDLCPFRTVDVAKNADAPLLQEKFRIGLVHQAVAKINEQTAPFRTICEEFSFERLFSSELVGRTYTFKFNVVPGNRKFMAKFDFTDGAYVLRETVQLSRWDTMRKCFPKEAKRFPRRLCFCRDARVDIAANLTRICGASDVVMEKWITGVANAIECPGQNFCTSARHNLKQELQAVAPTKCGRWCIYPGGKPEGWEFDGRCWRRFCNGTNSVCFFRASEFM